MKDERNIFLSVVICLLTITGINAKPADDLKIWYTKPATGWLESLEG